MNEERSEKESLLAFAEHRREECARRARDIRSGPTGFEPLWYNLHTCARSEEAYHASLSRRRSPVRIRSGAPRKRPQR